MRLTAHFFCLNEHFSQEHADAQHNGEESENNFKIEWEDELAINSDVSLVETIVNGTYIIAGDYPNGDTFSYQINNMLIFKVISKDGTMNEFACSEIAVDSYELIENKEDYLIKVFLKGEEPCINPIPGIYIFNKDFPEQLIV